MADIFQTNSFGATYPNLDFDYNKFSTKTTSEFFDEALKETSLYTLQVSPDEIVEREVVYYFDIIKSHKVQLQSQITDYWLEDSTAVQDSVNLQPIIINLSGLVGEVVFTPPSTFTGKIIDKLNRLFPSKSGFTLTQKLGTIVSLVPSVDNYTQIAKNAINYTEAAYNRYKKLFEQIQSWRNGTTSNTVPRQEQIYKQFEMFWKNKTPLMVNTPYGLFDNMYIQNVTMQQGETNTVSDISVTLKQLSFKDVIFTKAGRSVVEKYNSQAQAEVENLGASKNTAKNLKSLLKGGAGFFTNLFTR